MKANDMQIISVLRRNARERLVNIAKETNIPVSTVFDKLKANRKLIKKYAALVDFPKLGYHIRVLTLLDTHHSSTLREFVHTHGNVNSAFKIDGEYTFALDCIFKEFSDLESFLQELNHQVPLVKIKTSFVIEEIVREMFLAGGSA